MHLSPWIWMAWIVVLMGCSRSPESTPAPTAEPVEAPPSETIQGTPPAVSQPAPISCETVDDCWASPDPGAAPIRRPDHLRGRAFKICHDGEGEPLCTHGFCTLVFYEC